MWWKKYKLWNKKGFGRRWYWVGWCTDFFLDEENPKILRVTSCRGVPPRQTDLSCYTLVCVISWSCPFLPLQPVLSVIDTLNPLNAELNPICHLLALLGAHHILHVGRIRVNWVWGSGWMMLTGENRNSGRKKPVAMHILQPQTYTGLDSNSGLRCASSATNRMDHGRAVWRLKLIWHVFENLGPPLSNVM
jgi:hypothetical protein